MLGANYPLPTASPSQGTTSLIAVGDNWVVQHHPTSTSIVPPASTPSQVHQPVSPPQHSLSNLSLSSDEGLGLPNLSHSLGDVLGTANLSLSPGPASHSPNLRPHEQLKDSDLKLHLSQGQMLRAHSYSLSPSSDEGSGSFSNLSPRSIYDGYREHSSLSEVAARLAASLSGVLDSVSETLSVTATEEDAWASLQAAVPSSDQATAVAGRHTQNQGGSSLARPLISADVTSSAVHAESDELSAVQPNASAAMQPVGEQSSTVPLLSNSSRSSPYGIQTAPASSRVDHLSAVWHQASDTGTDSTAEALIRNTAPEASVSVPSLADTAAQTAERIARRADASMALCATAPTASEGFASGLSSSLLSSSPSLSEKALAAAFPVPHAAAAVADSGLTATACLVSKGQPGFHILNCICKTPFPFLCCAVHRYNDCTSHSCSCSNSGLASIANAAPVSHFSVPIYVCVGMIAVCHNRKQSYQLMHLDVCECLSWLSQLIQILKINSRSWSIFRHVAKASDTTAAHATVCMAGIAPKHLSLK